MGDYGKDGLAAFFGGTGAGSGFTAGPEGISCDTATGACGAGEGALLARACTVSWICAAICRKPGNGMTNRCCGAGLGCPLSSLPAGAKEKNSRRTVPLITVTEATPSENICSSNVLSARQGVLPIRSANRLRMILHPPRQRQCLGAGRLVAPYILTPVPRSKTRANLNPEGSLTGYGKAKGPAGKLGFPLPKHDIIGTPLLIWAG